MNTGVGYNGLPTGAAGTVDAALTAYGSNPATTAGSAADTLFKFGSAGTTQFTHCVIQNNTGSNIFYAFDQSTTVSTNMVYVLATGQTAFWDRLGTVIHFSSAASQNFGGQTGITVEAFG